jgi:hypothetical protein
MRGCGGLWMKLHERCDYNIDLALRLNFIKKFHLKCDQNFTSESKIDWGECLRWM